MCWRNLYSGVDRRVPKTAPQHRGRYSQKESECTCGGSASCRYGTVLRNRLRHALSFARSVRLDVVLPPRLVHQLKDEKLLDAAKEKSKFSGQTEDLFADGSEIPTYVSTVFIQASAGLDDRCRHHTRLIIRGRSAEAARAGRKQRKDRSAQADPRRQRARACGVPELGTRALNSGDRGRMPRTLRAHRLVTPGTIRHRHPVRVQGRQQEVVVAGGTPGAAARLARPHSSAVREILPQIGAARGEVRPGLVAHAVLASPSSSTTRRDTARHQSMRGCGPM
jgi:hypothetical protein